MKKYTTEQYKTAFGFYALMQLCVVALDRLEDTPIRNPYMKNLCKKLLPEAERHVKFLFSGLSDELDEKHFYISQDSAEAFMDAIAKKGHDELTVFLRAFVAGEVEVQDE